MRLVSQWRSPVIAVDRNLSALLPVDNSPTCHKPSSNKCKWLFAKTEFFHRSPPSSIHIEIQPQTIVKSPRKTKVNMEGGVSCLKWKASVFGLRARRPTGKPSEVEHFHISPAISTLLHVAIMRDKAPSNEQLHVVRAVPITNHCVWRKTFLCTNIRALRSPGSASPSGGEEGAGRWMDTSAERTSRCHAHPCLGQWRHSDRMHGLWFPLIDCKA